MVKSSIRSPTIKQSIHQTIKPNCVVPNSECSPVLKDGAIRFMLHVRLSTLVSPLGVRDYSVLKLLTGLVTAAFIAWKLMVRKAITIAATPAIKKIHHSRCTRYAKSPSHLFITTHAIGDAI